MPSLALSIYRFDVSRRDLKASDAKLEIALGSGNVSAPLLHDVSPDVTAYWGAFTRWRIEVALTPDLLRRLAESRFEGYRAVDGAGYLEFDKGMRMQLPLGKAAKKLQLAARCLAPPTA